MPKTQLSINKKGAKILIVEDNEINKIVVCEILGENECDLKVVENGEQAIDAVLKEKYDLVLMDCEMPGMDGYEATKIIRDHEQKGEKLARSGDKLAIIAVTANAIKGDRERCIETGMDDYVSKPFDPVELFEVINSHIPAE
ncbi:MAG: response regulator [Planctomycetes bacterium]|nr:response regulator [Planctomycetota bacterium]